MIRITLRTGRYLYSSVAHQREDVRNKVKAGDWVWLKRYSQEPGDKDSSFYKELLNISPDMELNTLIYSKLPNKNLSNLSFSLEWLTTVHINLKKPVISFQAYQNLLERVPLPRRSITEEWKDHKIRI
jgi:hypothetical protein